MRKDTKKQYINIFKIKIYLFIILALLIVFKFIYILSHRIIKHFYDWSQHPYYEVERILFSAVLTSLLAYIVKKILKKRTLRFLISRIYSMLCKLYLTSKNVFICKLIECFINIVYKGGFLPIKEQSSVAEEILNDLIEITKGNSAAHLFIISGDAHSGKTILAKKIVNDIFTKDEYIFLLRKYNRSIFYYDFSCFNDKLDDILTNYLNNYYSDNFLIFDNIHKLGNTQIKQLLKNIIREPNNAKCVLMLTRDINYILEGELVSEIEEKKKTHLLRTPRLSKLKFDEEYDLSGEFFDFLKELNIDQNLLNNSYIKFHLYYVYHIYMQNKNTATKKLFKQINCMEYDKILVYGFLFICCSTLFTGTINKKIFKKWIGSKNLTLYLNTYIEIGVLYNFQGVKSWEYSMHEKTARAYVEYFCQKDMGVELCLNFFRFLFENSEGNIKYRYSLPFDEYKNMIPFDEIINEGNFQTLYEDFKFIIKLFRLKKEHFNYELSVLNDRIGKFNLTKDNILELYNTTNNPKHLILLLHADHMMYYHDDFHLIYNAMAKSDNIYLRFATNYWIMHIEMHEGKWDLKSFINILKMLPENLGYIANESYETFHVLRRFYFDCFRIYYLQGNVNFLEFESLTKELDSVREYLCNNLTEFKFYQLKFVYAHYIHYELLFKYYVLDQTYIKREELEFVGCTQAIVMHNKAVDFYYKAYKYFYENGDKTYNYVLLRLCELAPDFVLLKIKKVINEKIDLKDFTEEYFKIIMGIFDTFRDECGISENVLEYAAYAETYKIKFALICKIMCSNIEIDFDEIIDNCIQSAIEYHKTYNPQFPNQYGIIRITIFKSINDFIVNKDYATLAETLEKIQKLCKQKNYNREVKLIDAIKKMNSKIKLKRIYHIIRYYPIVLQ